MHTHVSHVQLPYMIINVHGNRVGGTELNIGKLKKFEKLKI